MGKKLTKMESFKEMKTSLAESKQAQATAQEQALKNYVDSLVRAALDSYTKTISSMVIQEKTATMTRQLAFEKLLKQRTDWYNEEILAEAVAEVEDDAVGKTSTNTPIEVGDTVRMQFRLIKDGEPEAPWQKLALHSVARAFQDRYQANEQFEKALIGLQTGAKSTLAFEEEGGTTKVEVQIMRVSRKKPEAVK